MTEVLITDRYHQVLIGLYEKDMVPSFEYRKAGSRPPAPVIELYLCATKKVLTDSGMQVLFNQDSGAYDNH